MKKAKRQLPAPDKYGNYWLGDLKKKKDGSISRVDGPCILISAVQVRLLAERADSGIRPAYMASLGDATNGVGMLTDEKGIIYFETPQEAFDAIEAELAKIGRSKG